MSSDARDSPRGDHGRAHRMKLCLMLFLWMPTCLHSWCPATPIADFSSNLIVRQSRRQRLLYFTILQAQQEDGGNGAPNQHSASSSGAAEDPKFKALSALSQPAGDSKARNLGPKGARRDSKPSISSLLPPPLDPPPSANKNNKSGNSRPPKKKQNKQRAKAKMHPSKKFLHGGTKNSSKGRNHRPPKKRPSQPKQSANRDRYASMLPPPLKSPSDYDDNEDADDAYKSDSITDFEPSGLSSWEQFLGTKPRPEPSSDPSQLPPASDESKKQQDELSQKPPSMAKLPSIQDLFPPDLSFPTRNTTDSQSDTPSSSPRTRQRQRQRQPSNILSSPDGPFFSDSQKISQTNPENAGSKSQSQPQQQDQPALEGVLPVSDLFYRSSQSITANDDRMDTDDAELPFSAEQTDELAVDHNKVKVRRNQALETLLDKPKMAFGNNNNGNRNHNQQSRKGNKTPKRKMVRRGMEMLVGGVPINADPPQRSIELFNLSGDQPWHTAISVNTRDFGPFFSDTCQHQLTDKELALFCEFWVHSTMKWDVCPKNLRSIVQEYYKENEDISSEIGSNASLQQQHSSKPAPQQPSKLKLPSSRISLEMQEKKDKLKELRAQISNAKETAVSSKDPEEPGQEMMEALADMQEMMKQMEDMAKALGVDTGDDDQEESSEPKTRGFGKPNPKSKPKMSPREREAEKVKRALLGMRDSVAQMEATLNEDPSSKELGWDPEGFGKAANGRGKNRKQKKSQLGPYVDVLEGEIEISFDLAVSKNDLETTGEEGENRGKILKEVFQKGVEVCLERELPADPTKMMRDMTADPSSREETLVLDDVEISKLELTDLDDGTTGVSLGFRVHVMPLFIDSEKAKQKLGRICDKIVNSGEMCLSMAAVAEGETRWPKEFRDRVYEDFLFEDDDEDKTIWEETEAEDSTAEEADNNDKAQDKEETIETNVPPSPPPVTDAVAASKDDEPAAPDSRFLRGGPDGVFWDYSEANESNAPFQGKLGDKLLAAVKMRSEATPPKLIAVGDVHGCVDELQDLLRQCDYHPGDLIVFLGDLVSKGPDSISVVQMSREIGAIGVRGNHDFEVIRWHQAIKSGVDPPVVGSEHYHVASCLSKADVKWLYSLPWYITSKGLSALFVHAGFVSGIRLAKQNPRLMMNMRSILPDGTVTSKFFNNWPWARLWDGPQTVYFGHDADRGLQQYEHAIGLDTGCVYGGRLTACILPEKRLVSVSARREYFKYRRKHYD